MNALRCKCPVPRRVVVGGDRWQVRAVSQNRIDVAHMTARELSRGFSGSCQRLEDIVQVVAVVSSESAEKVRRLLPEHLIKIYREWTKVQSESNPNMSALDAELRLAVLDDEMVSRDGAVAHAASSASDYYGAPIGDLTLGQIGYYMSLKAAYHEMHVEKSNRKVSRKWLEQQKRKNT